MNILDPKNGDLEDDLPFSIGWLLLFRLQASIISGSNFRIPRELGESRSFPEALFCWPVRYPFRPFRLVKRFVDKHLLAPDVFGEGFPPKQKLTWNQKITNPLGKLENKKGQPSKVPWSENNKCPVSLYVWCLPQKLWRRTILALCFFETHSRDCRIRRPQTGGNWFYQVLRFGSKALDGHAWYILL